MTNAGGWDQAEADRVLIASFVKITRLGNTALARLFLNFVQVRDFLNLVEDD